MWFVKNLNNYNYSIMIQRVTGSLERVSLTGPAPSTALLAALSMRIVAITLTIITVAEATATWTGPGHMSLPASGK